MAEDYKTLKPGIEHNVPQVYEVQVPYIALMLGT